MADLKRFEVPRVGWIAAALLALQLGMLLHAAWRVGPTADEHHYLAAGYTYLEDWDFARNREHPPLLKMLIALPLWLMGDARFPEHWRDLVDFPVAFFYQTNLNQLDRNLFLSRLLPSLLTVLGSGAVFLVGWRVLGSVGGLVALLLFAFDPNVIAHGSLATLDNGVSVLMFGAVATLVGLLEAPSARKALLAGILFGLANLAKFTALLLVPVELGLAALIAVRRRSVAPLGWTALAMLAGLGVFSAGYGFEAVSINEAWAEPPYVEDLNAGGMPSPSGLAESARAAGVSAQKVESIASAPSSLDAVERLGELLEGGGGEAAAALETLAGLGYAPSDHRKLACARILGAREVLEPEPCMHALELLTRAHQSDLDAWQRWFDARRSEGWDRAIFTRPWIERLVHGTFGDDVPVPLFTAWKGLDYQLDHGERGHGTYYRGRIIEPREFRDGNPYPQYYLDVLAVKHPLPWLLAVVGGFYGWTRRGRHRTLLRTAAAILVPAFLLVVFSRSNMLMGVRYVMPVLPFLALVGGALALPFPRIALGLAVCSALAGNRMHPHQLMYYGALGGGPSQGHRITVLSDEWGQGQREMGRFYERFRVQIEAAGGLYFEPHHAADPASFGLIPARPVRGRPEGIVAVNLLSYYRERDPEEWSRRRYEWLEEYRPFTCVDHAIWLFDTRGGPPGGNPLEAWLRDEAAAAEAKR